jgi:hypothetical protein
MLRCGKRGIGLTAAAPSARRVAVIIRDSEPAPAALGPLLLDDAEIVRTLALEGLAQMGGQAEDRIIAFEGDAPDAETLARLHHEAHERCFIANSLKSEVVIEG